MATDPISELLQARRLAGQAGDPYAAFCCLATLDTGGCPVLRTITVRSLDQEGLTVFVSDRSPKVEQLAGARDKVEVLFFWQSVMQQFRMRGEVQLLRDSPELDQWEGKPHASKIADCYHAQMRAQSSVVASRQQFVDEFAALALRNPPGADLPRPESVVALRVIPNFIEVWIGSDQDRIHDRRRYTRRPSGWVGEHLVP